MVVDVTGQQSCDVIGQLSVKPCCHFKCHFWDNTVSACLLFHSKLEPSMNTCSCKA